VGCEATHKLQNNNDPYGMIEAAVGCFEHTRPTTWIAGAWIAGNKVGGGKETMYSPAAGKRSSRSSGFNKQRSVSSGALGLTLLTYTEPARDM
jgi:hypothetical protein